MLYQTVLYLIKAVIFGQQFLLIMSCRIVSVVSWDGDPPDFILPFVMKDVTLVATQ
jgi:hypothetical protein